jgi:hypothetical protein
MWLASAVAGLVGAGFVTSASATPEGDSQQQTPTQTEKPKGKCAPGKLRMLQTRVTRACKSKAKPYSCARGQLTCQQVKIRKSNALACKRARVAVQGCFDSTDEGHKTAIDNAQKAADTCHGKIARACRVGGGEGQTGQTGPRKRPRKRGGGKKPAPKQTQGE